MFDKLTSHEGTLIKKLFVFIALVLGISLVGWIPLVGALYHTMVV